MSNPTQYPQQPAGAPQAPQPPAAPTTPGAAPMFLMILAVIGIVSFVVDFVAGGQIVDGINAVYKKAGMSDRASMADFNVGSMYVNLVLMIVIGILGMLVRSGKNGARITGAVLAIFTMLGGIGGTIYVLLGAAGDAALESQYHMSIIPGWYVAVGVAVALAQAVVSLLAVITLFGSKAKTHCTTPQP